MASKQTTFAVAARAAALGLWLSVTAGALVASPAYAAEKKEELSPKVAKLYKPAADAFNKGDYDAALTLGNQALEACEKPYDQSIILRLIGGTYAKQKNYPAYADLLEKINALTVTPEADRILSYKPLAQINAQQKNWAKSAEYATLWANNGGGLESYQLLWQVYLTQGDCEHGIPWLEKAVADHEPTEPELLQENRCYYKLNLRDKRKGAMEALVKRFMKHDYISDLLGMYDDDKIDSRAKLNIRRLEFLKDYMTRESEYVDYAEKTLDLGSPNEALSALNQGIHQNTVKLIAASDLNSRMLAQAKQQAADDKRQVAALDREAQAGKNGEADVKVGLVYLGLADYQKAVDAITRGLAADRVARVKRVDDANMMLGIAYWKLGKADEAKQAFTAAQADARMANAAMIWLAAL
jgi:tetratricopeptide repeat protein